MVERGNSDDRPQFFFLSYFFSPLRNPARPPAGANRLLVQQMRAALRQHAKGSPFQALCARERKARFFRRVLSSDTHAPLSQKLQEKTRKSLFYRLKKSEKARRIFLLLFSESNQEMRGTSKKEGERGRRGGKKLVFVERSTKVSLETSLDVSLSINSLFFFDQIPLRAYARVVLRGLPASETSHHLWSETQLSKRGDIARCRGSNPRVRAKLFFPPFC